MFAVLAFNYPSFMIEHYGLPGKPFVFQRIAETT